MTSIFAYGYRYYGINELDRSDSTDFKWRPHQFKSNFEEGFSWILTDENGYNNDFCPQNIDVLIMGGSHMEANQVMPHQKASYLLGKITGKNVYNIGMTDHTIFMCLDNLKNAITAYHPRECVIIQTSSLKITNDIANAILNGNRKKLQLHTNSFIPIFLRKIPAIMLVYKQFRDKLKIEFSNTASGIESYITPDIDIINKLFLKSKAICDKNGIKLIIAYTPEIIINKSGIERKDNFTDVEFMKNMYQKNGIILYDMWNKTLNGFNNNKKIPFGFDNTRIGYGHLNSYGHQLLAQELANIIKIE